MPINKKMINRLLYINTMKYYSVIKGMNYLHGIINEFQKCYVEQKKSRYKCTYCVIPFL